MTQLEGMNHEPVQQGFESLSCAAIRTDPMFRQDQRRDLLIEQLSETIQPDALAREAAAQALKAFRDCPVTRAALVKKLGEHATESEEVTLAVANTAACVAPGLHFDNASLVHFADILGRHPESISASPNLAAAIVSRIPAMPPDQALKSVNSLFSQPLTEGLGNTVEREFGMHAEFWQELRGVSKEAAKNLLNGALALADRSPDLAREVPYANLWAAKQLCMHPEVFAAESRPALLHYFVEELARHQRLGWLACENWKTPEVKEALSTVNPEKVAPFFPVSPMTDALESVQMFSPSVRSAILKKVLEHDGYQVEMFMKSAGSNLDLNVLTEHASANGSHLPILLDKLRQFETNREGMAELANALDSRGKFSLLVERVNVMPLKAAAELENDYQLLSYRRQVGVPDQAVYQEYLKRQANPGDCAEPLASWAQRQRLAYEARSRQPELT